MFLLGEDDALVRSQTFPNACKWYFGCAVGSIDKLWFTAVWFTIYCNWFTAVAELQINAIASPLTDIIRFISHC